ncbi:hypothetical protein M514_06501 [Trichuris suis]|uniref:Zinc-hook domain-containing protein n=1 Tax=Trichuris suis TaxID=68888 RepID=A0A085N2Z3_9BILA|nr:hypothetical protein M514_06501 [Trichuris suis]
MSNMQNKELLYSNAVQELELLEQRIRDANVEVSACVQKLNAVNVSSRCSYAREIKNITRQLEELQVEKGSVDGAYFLYRKYISHAQVTLRCPVCDRGFDKPNEAESFIGKISEDMSAIPNRQQCLDGEINVLIKRRDELLDQRGTLDAKDRLENNTLPELNKMHNILCEGVNALRISLGKAKENFSSLSKDVELVESLRGDAAVISVLHEEITKLEENVTLRRDKLRSIDAIIPSSELQSLLEDKHRLLNTINTNMEHSLSLLNAERDRLQTLRDMSHRLTEEKADIFRSNEQVASLSRQHREILIDMERLRREEEEANRDLACWERRDEELLFQLNELEEKWVTNSRVEELLIDKHTKAFQELENLWNYLKQQCIRERQLRLNALEEELINVQGNITDLQSRKSAENDRLYELRNGLSQADVRKRELADNVKLRKEKQLCLEMQEKISLLQQQLADLTFSREEFDIEDLNQQYCLRLKTYNESTARLAVLEERKESIMKDLQSEGCKDAKKVYERKLIDINVADVICEDLLKYTQALENAIIVYHQSKMQQINNIIKDLWENVYKGDDIEYVEIKSEEARLSTEKRRCYSYRVVMFCDGIELDMRGRCSTGQKVLASIIIRIALAEVFSSNCGFFALDEPTTNLDATNSESLACALADLLKVRSMEKHFQLILITHDNNFVENMLRHWPLDVFYHVSKDKSGCTQLIEKHVEYLYSK